MAHQWRLKYGLNPHQGRAVATFQDGEGWLEVLNGQVGYINLLDALRAWTLARELATTFGAPSAASIKHVHPAGAAIARELDLPFRAAHGLGDEEYSPLATAYARARAGDRIAAFGDFIGLSEPVDKSCAHLIARRVSDGVIAPGYSAEALNLLSKKKKGTYVVIKADPEYEWSGLELRREHGLELQQSPNRVVIAPELFQRPVVGTAPLPSDAIADLQLATIVAKHTPSNAVCVALDGQAIGIGGGQQARIYATRSACEKADLWRLQLHPRAIEVLRGERSGKTIQLNLVRQWLLWDELDDRERALLQAAAPSMPAPLTNVERREWLAAYPLVVMSSDGSLAFADNVYRAARSNVCVIAQPGESTKDEAVTDAANEVGIAMVHTGVRLFWH